MIELSVLQYALEMRITSDRCSSCFQENPGDSALTRGWKATKTAGAWCVTVFCVAEPLDDPEATQTASSVSTCTSLPTCGLLSKQSALSRDTLGTGGHRACVSTALRGHLLSAWLGANTANLTEVPFPHPEDREPNTCVY